MDAHVNHSDPPPNPPPSLSTSTQHTHTLTLTLGVLLSGAQKEQSPGTQAPAEQNSAQGAERGEDKDAGG